METWSENGRRPHLKLTKTQMEKRDEERDEEKARKLQCTKQSKIHQYLKKKDTKKRRYRLKEMLLIHVKRCRGGGKHSCILGITVKSKNKKKRDNSYC